MVWGREGGCGGFGKWREGRVRGRGGGWKHKDVGGGGRRGGARGGKWGG